MMQSRWFRFAGILPLVGALAGMTGCGTEAAPTSEGVASDPLVQAPPSGAQAGAQAGAADDKDDVDGPKGDWRGHRGGRHSGAQGPAHLLRAALHKLDLSDAQKATIKGALEGLHDGAKDAPKDLAAFTALADAVRSGSIDRSAIAAKLPSAERGNDEHRAKVASALGTLHTTLTKEQRRQLVDSIAAKMDKHGAKGEHADKGERGPKGEHGPKGERGGKEGHGMKGGPLGHMLRDLDVRDDQRAQIQKAMEGLRPSDADRDTMKKEMETKRAEMRARLELFAADRFDASAFLPADADADKKSPRVHLDRMVDALVAIVPILDKAQRDALADRIAEGPRAGKGGPGHKGMRGGERR